MAIIIGYGFALLTATLAIVGDYYIKLAADSGRSLISIYFTLGALFYIGSAAMWFGSLRQIGLAQAGVAYSMLTLLAVCAMGVLLFEEKLQMREVCGVICALLSMILMVRFSES